MRRGPTLRTSDGKGVRRPPRPPPAADHSRALPYTRVTATPATDEPAPSTLTQPRLTAQLDWLHAGISTRTHLTGAGGDSILFQPHLYLADLICHCHWRRAAGEAFGWARLRHTQVPTLLHDAAIAARTSRRHALADLAQAVGTHDRNDHGRVRWFPLLPFPTWAEPPARRRLTQAALQAAATPDPLLGLDAAVRSLVDEIREVARTAAADAQLAAACGIDLHNPFLDPTVMDAVLRTPIGQRPPVHAYKPLLSRAMAGLLPPAVAARTIKGSFDAGLRAKLPDLRALTHGHLANLGLINPTALDRALREAASGIPTPLATLEQALARRSSHRTAGVPPARPQHPTSRHWPLIWRHHRDEASDGEAEVLARLDTLEQAVAAIEPEQRAAMAGGMQVPVREILAACVGDDQPEALQELIDALEARAAETPVISHQTVTRNLALGNINVAGRDNNLGGSLMPSPTPPLNEPTVEQDVKGNVVLGDQNITSRDNITNYLTGLRYLRPHPVDPDKLMPANRFVSPGDNFARAASRPTVLRERCERPSRGPARSRGTWPQVGWAPAADGTVWSRSVPRASAIAPGHPHLTREVRM
ncbi:albusnodin/ikarugamycin family macrolactam cyclase [Streptomyces noursei]|uniref:albusnodin/ikarugamycin family macrolactam cyclase n=1 Tax=Streptomyces noursei TaxID=1971 RepID=UPI0038143E9E